jgi:uncharacterized coiled-coil protein SlyX
MSSSRKKHVKSKGDSPPARRAPKLPNGDNALHAAKSSRRSKRSSSVVAEAAPRVAQTRRDSDADVKHRRADKKKRRNDDDGNTSSYLNASKKPSDKSRSSAVKRSKSKDGNDDSKKSNDTRKSSDKDDLKSRSSAVKRSKSKDGNDDSKKSNDTFNGVDVELRFVADDRRAHATLSSSDTGDVLLRLSAERFNVSADDFECRCGAVLINSDRVRPCRVDAALLDWSSTERRLMLVDVVERPTSAMGRASATLQARIDALEAEQQTQRERIDGLLGELAAATDELDSHRSRLDRARLVANQMAHIVNQS